MNDVNKTGDAGMPGDLFTSFSIVHEALNKYVFE